MVKYSKIMAIVMVFCSTFVYAEQRPEPLDYILNMVHHNPGEPLFITKYVRPDYLAEIGYNGDCPRYYIQTAITYDEFEDGIVPNDSATRHWIQRYAKNLDHAIRMHKEENLPLYPFTDILVVPKEIMDKYGEQMKDTKGHLSIQRPMTQKIMRAQIAEIFNRFPDLDGLMTRFGETYLCDTPFHVGDKPVHSREDHVLLINILREEVCVKRNKKLFYRTWDFGKNFHVNPDYYLEVTDKIEPHPNLIFSVKHSNYDFVRGVPVNKTIGIGKHKQVIEVSLMQAGCYGKGAYPYYIGKGILHGWSDMKKPEGISELVATGKIVGLFIWPRGDSWSGPYLTSEFWPDLNGYIFREFAKRPSCSDRELFQEYCAKHLDLSKADTAKLYKLCLLTDEAVFAGVHSEYFNVSVWYQRDDKFNDPPNLPDPKEVSHSKILAEKAHAVKLWKDIETLSKEINIPNADDQEYLEVSSTYGRIYFSILEKLWTLKVYDAKTLSDADKKIIKQTIDEYDELWDEWYKLEREHSCCATLYMTCWPQTWPPTWREERDSSSFKPHHDTPLVKKYRNMK